MYKLEKLKIEEGKRSMVYAGDSYTHSYLTQLLMESDIEPKRITSLLDIETGLQVALGPIGGDYSVRTSPIKDILARGDNSVMFRTQTSIYLLTKEEEHHE